MAIKPSFFRPWERSPVNKAPDVENNIPKPDAIQGSPRKSPNSVSLGLPLALNYAVKTPSPCISRPACTPSPADSAYSGSTSSCSPAPSPTASPAIPNMEVLEQWYLQHIDLPYPSNKETKELGRKCGLNFHQVRKWMSKRRSNNVPSSANGKIYKDSNLQQGTPKKSSSAIMQRVRAKSSPYQLPQAIPVATAGIPSIAAGIPFLPGMPTTAPATSLHIPRPPHFYMYQQEHQAMHAIYLQQLMAAQGLPVQHVQSLHTGH